MEFQKCSKLLIIVFATRMAVVILEYVANAENDSNRHRKIWPIRLLNELLNQR